ncbi:uncharacterized protein [Littorina saxatilis]|uniref:uncharacterized protein isoform X1 n=1 Tax=Littorina saxatilis TaxID=31220 RepID=UPI0038B4301B
MDPYYENFKLFLTYWLMSASHGELSDVLPVGALGGSDQNHPQGSLQIPHSLLQQHQQQQQQHRQQQQQQHHQQQQQQQQQQLQNSQSSHHHQQMSQQQNHSQGVGGTHGQPVGGHSHSHSQGVGGNPQHEPISPHHNPHQQQQQQPPPPSHQQQLQHQSMQTLDLEHHPLPSHSVPPPPLSSSSTSSSLQMHSQGVNTSEMGMDLASSSQRPHLCTICLKTFRSKQQLAQHSLVHTNIRKYTCSYCERAFKQLSHLQQHTRIHTGEKPYQCKFEGCDRAFAQLSNLQHHMRNHDDQVKKESTRIHKCLICHRSYTNESSLKAHTLKMHIHIKQVPLDGQAMDGQVVKKRRKKKNKQLYDDAPTMVPLNHPDAQACKKSLSDSESDDDLIIIGERRQQDFAQGLQGMPRSLVESLNHYERTLAAGMGSKKVQDGNISSSNQLGAQQLGAQQLGAGGLRGMDGRATMASLGLQGLMNLPGIDPALMSAQPPEVIERAAAAAAAAVSSQLLQSGYTPMNTNNHNNNQQPHPQPAHSQANLKGGGGGGGNSSSNNMSGRTSVSTPQPQLQPLTPLDMVGMGMGMGAGQYPPHKPYSQLMDAHLRSQVAPMSLPTMHEQYYAGPPLGMLSHHTRFLGPPRSMADLPMSYASHSSAAPSPVTATANHLSLPSVSQSNSRPPSNMGSPQHVSEALNFNP